MTTFNAVFEVNAIIIYYRPSRLSAFLLHVMHPGRSEDGDPVFLTLSTALRARIDRAFDSIVRTEPSKPARKRRRLDQDAPSRQPPSAELAGGFVIEEPQAGGFILEDNTPGGFVVDDDEPSSDSNARTASPQAQEPLLSLDEAPLALERLGLTADEDVLSVLRNAAGGWGGDSRGNGASGVSRRDWRAVCAVLLENAESSGEDGEGEDAMIVPQENDINDSAEDDDDAYAESSLSDDNEAEDDLYVDEPASRRKTNRGRGRGARNGSDSDDDAPKTLTPRQKRECLRAFALFFDNSIDDDPSTDLSQYAERRLEIRDVSRTAKLLKEQLSADNVRLIFDSWLTARR
jgi:hypothetical protein